MNKHEILKLISQRLLEYLEELATCSDNKDEQFEYGEKTAYVEVLEMIQEYANAKEIGLDFDIEEKFPL